MEGGPANTKKKAVPAGDWQEKMGDEVLKSIMKREGNMRYDWGYPPPGPSVPIED